jgi:hypothetical protein
MAQNPLVMIRVFLELFTEGAKESSLSCSDSKPARMRASLASNRAHQPRRTARLRGRNAHRRRRTGGLEHFSYLCSDAVAAMADVIATLGRGEEAERGSHERVDVIEAPWSRRPEERLQFGERLFDRIVVRTVRREKAEMRTDLFESGPHLGLFVDGEVIQHHDIARSQRRHQDLFDIREETRIVDGSVEDRGRTQPVKPQPRDHRVRLPVAAGRVIVEPVAARTAPISPQQIGRHPTFIEKHVLTHVPQWQPRGPLATRGDDIRPSLFGGVYGFF